MNESPYLSLKPARHVAAAQPSPTRHRLADDILSHLSPASVVDALSSATGALRQCLQSASIADQEFAMRTAVTSKRIWEWVEELQDWSWPAGGGHAGFEPPGGARRKLFVQITAPEGEDSQFLGSLSAEEADQYEKRITEMQQNLDDLDVEEIKSHVLTNHILPLSRPGSPESVMSTCSNYTKMDDLTAVVTAIVVQALPNLAKLSQLLHTWDLRLTVLRQIPSLMLDIEDAEIALKSGWNAVSTPVRSTGLEVVLEEEEEEGEEAQGSGSGSANEDGRDTTSPWPESKLMRKDYDVMRLVLEKKVSKPGRTLDHMLDCLEGMSDTLPDEWLDRMEAVETDYAEWVAACERKMRETEWVNAVRPPQMIHSSPSKASSNSSRAHSADLEEPSDDSHNTSILSETSEASTIVQDPPRAKALPGSQAGGSPTKKQKQKLPALQEAISFDGIKDIRIPSANVQPPTPVIDDNPIMMRGQSPYTPGQSFGDDSDSAFDVRSPMSEDDELELPPLVDADRRNSDESFGGSFSDLPEVSASPNLPKGRIREAEYLQASPPSSPPLASRRGSLMTPFDSPFRTPNTDEENYFLPRTPLGGSLGEEFENSFEMSEAGRPDRRESMGDQHLRQQIRQIIGSMKIPAKIKLSASPGFNLNPPDLNLPRMRKKTSREPFKRSTSSMSSRATTPSFTLSPAKNPRPRRRGQQEIKVYHLSRPNGENPIKLFIRCVGENGERVMVRVGGGWADLGEYLKEYANHHKRRSAATRDASVEVRDVPRLPSSHGSNVGSSPPRPPSSQEGSPMSPLALRKARRSVGAMNSEPPRLRPNTPAVSGRPPTSEGPSPETSANRSRSSSHLSWADDDSSLLGLAGPTGKKVEMSEENRAWVESIKEKVRLASGEVRPATEERNRFGDLGRVGGTKRVFRKPEERRESTSQSRQ